jgi:hypothetical protein
MAEIPNEEPVDKENDALSGHFPEEIVVTNEQEIKQIADLESESVNPTPPSETMEVHHHGHVHSNKKWKEYLFQFFMLFLAVFCGFLAEYQLEHKIEHDREEVYMSSLIEDLVADTIEINTRLKNIDSMFIPVFEKSLDLLYMRDLSDSIVKELYRNVPNSIRFMDVKFEDRTKIQLTNSDNLRLIRCKQVTDSMAAYWKSCQGVIDPVITGYAETRSEAKWLVLELFDFTYFNEYASVKNLKENVQPKLNDPDQKKLIMLANHIANLQAQAKGPLRASLRRTKDRAKNLITLIKKEYHLE